MKTGVVALLLLSLASPQSSPAEGAEEHGIRQTVTDYLEGLATGDATRLGAAFHPEARMFQALASGKLMSRMAEEFAAGRKPRSASPDERFQILSIERTGSAAVAKIELDYPTVVFVDYLALVKIEGQWKIMAKISDRRVK